jgi:basic amino acid/polyamine antiporter, APA family
MSTTPPLSRPGLVRALGPLMATAVVVGTVIGSGVFKKPQAIAASVPNFSVVAVVWILGGVLAVLGALSLAEVAVLYPRAGGNYVFLREGYGRLASFLFGWVEFWIIRSASLAALATVFTESLHDILRETLGAGAGSTVLSYWEQRLLTVAIIVALALVNVRGVKWGGLLQLFITTVKVASLVGIFVLPLVVAVRPPSSLPGSPAASLAPPTFTLTGTLTAFLGVLWAYHGWMNIAPVAGEVRQPQRNLPLALLLGVGIIIALYLGANVAYHLVIPQGEMAALPKDTPVVTEFSLRLLGSVGALLASAAVMCSVFGALNGNLLVGPRLLYAMGEDGLAPRALGNVHPRFHTPAVAILIMAAWAALLVVAVGILIQTEILSPDKSHFDVMTDFAMFGAVIFDTMAVSTIFIFRRRLPHAERPYRCPGYPVVPALYMILPAMVLGNMFINQQVEALTGVGFIVLGAIVYQLFLRRPEPEGSPLVEERMG